MNKIRNCTGVATIIYYFLLISNRNVREFIKNKIVYERIQRSFHKQSNNDNPSTYTEHQNDCQFVVNNLVWFPNQYRVTIYTTDKFNRTLLNSLHFFLILPTFKSRQDTLRNLVVHIETKNTPFYFPYFCFLIFHCFFK